MAVKLEAGEVDLRNVSDADAQLLLEFSMEGQARPSTPAANPRVSIPALLNELESRHATKSMSISVEPEPQAIKQPKLGKGRGRVSRGPKKRQGKGWIIESCTTSGVASPEPDLPFLDPDLFGSDSDLTDIESEDPLAGLPPVPISSGSEYEPRVAGDSQVDYEAYQTSARPSVRLATRTPLNAAKKDVRKRGPKPKPRQEDSKDKPRKRTKLATKKSILCAENSTPTSPRRKVPGRKPKPKPPSVGASSVSLGDWQDDTTEAGSSPSLGGGRGLDSPSRRARELGPSGAARSDAGLTHVSESVEEDDQADAADEGERSRRWQMVQDERPRRKRRVSESARVDWREHESTTILRSFSSPIKPSYYRSRRKSVPVVEIPYVTRSRKRAQPIFLVVPVPASASGTSEGGSSLVTEPREEEEEEEAPPRKRTRYATRGKGKEPVRPRRYDGLDTIDEDVALSATRPRRHTKPTFRAVESALQDNEWEDEDVPARRRSRVVRVSEVSETSSTGTKRSASEVTESSKPRKSRKVKSESSGPIIQLYEGDYILRPQERRCWNYDYDQTIVPRCLACRKKKIGDTCRFLNVRWFQLNQRSMDPVGVKFDTRYKHKIGPIVEYLLPLKWNVTPVIAQVERMRLVIARALLPVLRDELAHAQKPNVIRRAIEIEVRATCDVCATSVFSSCQMCTRCGRELCGGCYRLVEEMCPVGTPLEYPPGLRRDRRLHKYRACAGGRIFHVPADFYPVTRFTREELEQSVQEMETVIQENQQIEPVASGSAQAQIVDWASSVPVWNPTSPHTSTEPPALSSAGSSHDVSSPRGTPDPQLPSMPAIASPTMSPTHEEGFAPDVVEPGKRPVVSHQGRQDPAAVPCHSTHYFSKEMDEETFKPLWARGEAVVVHGLLDQFKIKWTPEYFIDEHGEQKCLVMNCDNNKEQETNVAWFFEQFGKSDREGGVLKLKDWPAQADFKDDFPALFDDFMNALPVPNYTRRDGILNLASHFATNAIAPDLGPKMYNAFTSSEGPGGQGSTRLHMDMADAVNIMMYASDCPDGSPGVAAWDIFRASDSDKIRSYLRRHFSDKASEFRDPIHSQLFYLDSDHRKRLYEEEKVYSWRIYQRPGDAVFIPAGCAHQVCNLADCIKVAIDFVSLENIDRCEKLTAEFRNENDTFTWKEDVLQLRTMMMYAWRSISQLRKAWYEEYDRMESAETTEEQTVD